MTATSSAICALASAESSGSAASSPAAARTARPSRMELQVGEFSFLGARYFTGFARDLTERQEAERRIQDLQAGLLHASRLSVMGQMASTMAHELNQPLRRNELPRSWSPIARYRLRGARTRRRLDGKGDRSGA